MSYAKAGFTLLEVLVALAVLLAFAAALGPNLYQSRAILMRGSGRVAAHALLRSLIDAPFDRDAVGTRQTEGVTGGLRWQVAVQPQFLETPVFADTRNKALPPSAVGWVAYRVTARVWSGSQPVAAETLRLGRAR